MIRRLVVGFIWFIVVYFAACAVTGAIAGIRDMSQAPENMSPEQAYERGKWIGASAVLEIREYLLFGSAVFAGGGALVGVLPGTRSSGATPS